MIQLLHTRSFCCTKSCIHNSIKQMSTGFVITKPATVGERLTEVETPALVVPLPSLRRNLQRMKSFVDKHNQFSSSSSPLSYRPHVKTHKCSALAKMQLEEYGAKGVCAQILVSLALIMACLDEAEAMVNGGILDVFISNQIVGSKKIRRLCDIAKRGKISVVVDNMENLLQIADAARTSDAFIDVLIEVNAGQNRCGIEINADSGKLCIELAKFINESYHLRFKGIHCYHGALQHTRGAEDRKNQVMAGPVSRATEALKALKSAGIDVEVVTGGGTGSFPFEASSGLYTEIQPGSYCMMDVDYGDNDDGQNMFENALFLHSTVVSKTVAEGMPPRAVLDAGTKASSYDSGLPVPLKGWVNGRKKFRVERNEAEIQNGGDEHSLLVGEYANELEVGQTIRLLPGHVDPTVNMHQYLVIVDFEENSEEDCEPVVVDVWSIDGRSPGF